MLVETVEDRAHEVGGGAGHWWDLGSSPGFQVIALLSRWLLLGCYCYCRQWLLLPGAPTHAHAHPAVPSPARLSAGCGGG
jgi:hypothetical protein